ncbi:MAG: putative toxin-antitoxin system toxin component, PIN family [Bacteroidia bacterium]|nr:putative toxin-antitoxin system toxin component, PIN family [Bacteroidia bacterium]
MPKIRVVIDTNLWISFLISKRINELRTLILKKRIVVLFSNELLREFLEVVNRPKFHKHFTSENIKGLLNAFDEFGIIVETTSLANKCRDKKDNFLLDLSICGKAHYLITGDNDLLVIEKINNTKILTFTEFIHLIK